MGARREAEGQQDARGQAEREGGREMTSALARTVEGSPLWHLENTDIGAAAFCFISILK